MGRILLCSIAAFIVTFAAAARASVEPWRLNDGQVHLHPPAFGGNVQVADDPHGRPTTLYIGGGATVDTAVVLGHSILKLDGGTITNGLLTDFAAAVTLHGGGIGGTVYIWGVDSPPAEIDRSMLLEGFGLSVGYLATLRMGRVVVPQNTHAEVLGDLLVTDSTFHGVPWDERSKGQIQCSRCRFLGVDEPAMVAGPAPTPTVTARQQLIAAQRAAIQQALSQAAARGRAAAAGRYYVAPPPVSVPLLSTLHFAGETHLDDCELVAAQIGCDGATVVLANNAPIEHVRLDQDGYGGTTVDFTAADVDVRSIFSGHRAETRLSARRAVLYREPGGRLVLQRRLRDGRASRTTVDWVDARSFGRITVVGAEPSRYPLVIAAQSIRTPLPAGMEPPLPGNTSAILSLLARGLLPPVLLLGAYVAFSILHRKRKLHWWPVLRFSPGRPAIVFLALCLSFALLWQRSRTHADAWVGTRGTTIQILSSEAGLLRFWSSPSAGGSTDVGWSYHHGPASAGGSPPSRAPRLNATISAPATLPYWLPCLLLALWPMWRTSRLVRAAWLHWRAAGRTLCRHCGYDLRATPDRCRECGAVPRADRRSTVHA